MRWYKLILCTFLGMQCSIDIFNQTAFAATDPPATPADGSKPCYTIDPNTNKPDTNCKKIAQGSEPFKGLHWGAGIVYSTSLGGVGNVTRDGSNIVRVTQQNQGAARAAFELHYFLPKTYATKVTAPGGTRLTGDDCKFGWTDLCSWQMGYGPYVSLNTSPFNGFSNGQVFSSLGVGAMFGFSAFDEDSATSRHSVNLGVGVLVDTNVRKLAAGVADGKPTPTGITNNDQLTNAVTKYGFMAILSYNFQFN